MNLDLNRLFSNKPFVILGGLFFLVFLTLINVWVAQKTTKPSTQAQFSVTRLYWPRTSQTLSVDETFEANLIFDPGQNSISALDVIIIYNPGHLELLSITPNQEAATFVVQKSEPGKITFSALSKDYVTDPTFLPFTLANFQFRAKATGITTSILIDPESIAASAGKNLLSLDADSKLTVSIR